LIFILKNIKNNIFIILKFGIKNKKI